MIKMALDEEARSLDETIKVGLDAQAASDLVCEVEREECRNHRITTYMEDRVIRTKRFREDKPRPTEVLIQLGDGHIVRAKRVRRLD